MSIAAPRPIADADTHSSTGELRLEGVGKYYHETDNWAVRNLDISVRPGEFFGLLGPSGCGKTTTLNMIAGFLTPDEGEIRVDGNPISRVPPHKRGVSMVFQDYALFPHMSARDNVEFAMKVRKMPRDDRHPKSDDLLGLVELRSHADHMPSQLSGGQQQRVAVARALSVDPTIVLLDEPLSNLDTRLRVDVRRQLAEMFRRAGVTVILVTHDQGEAFAFCDRVAVLLQGKLQSVATPTELYGRPPSKEVAEFLGDANFFEARLQTAGSAGRSRAEIDAGGSVRTEDVSVAEGVADATAAGHVMIRPESMRLTSVGDSQPRPDLERIATGTVATADFLGESILYLVRTEAGLDLRIKAVFEGRVHTAGTPIDIWWHRESLHFVEQ